MIRHPDGYLFLPQRSRSGRARAKSPHVRLGVLTRDTIHHRWSEGLADARSAGVALPEGFFTRKLRATFVTAMREKGADFEVLQKYIGHAPTSILSAHYDAIGDERMRQIAELAKSLVEAV